MHMKKNVALLDLADVGCESDSIRQTLEYFGYFVGMHRIGRPQHVIDILAGKTSCAYDCFVFICHGDDDGKILMGELAEHIYFPDEPRGNFGYEEISRYLELKNTLIISTGCSTGNEALAKAFAKNGNIYIAPIDDPEGNSALIYTHLFFYHACYNDFNIEDAHNKARSVDAETGMFTLFRTIY